LTLRKFVSIVFSTLLLAALTLTLIQVSQADYNPSTRRLILSSESQWRSMAFQRKIFYSEGLWWFIYGNGTAQVYRTYAEATDTLSEPQLFRNDSNHGYDIDVALEDDGKTFHYAFYKGVMSQPLYYRKGQFSSDGSVTWVADEQTVLEGQETWWYENPAIGIDSYGYPFIAYFAIYNTGLSPNSRVIKSSTNNGVWTTDTGFPKNLSTIEKETRAKPVRMTNGKMMMVYTLDQTGIYAKLWNGTELGEETTLATGDITNYGFSCTSIDNNVYVAFYDETSYEWNCTVYNGISWGDSESLTPLRDPVNDWLEYYYGSIGSDPATNEVYFTYVYGAYPSTEYYTVESKIFRDNQWEDYIVWENRTEEHGNMFTMEHVQNQRLGILYEDVDNDKVYFQMIKGYDSKTHSDYNTELQANNDPCLKNFDGIVQDLNYSSTGVLNFSVWLPDSAVSKAEVYCSSIGEPINVTGASWDYNSTTKICNITATHESTVNITVDWRRFVYVHVLDAENSFDIEGASVYLATPLWSSDNVTTNSTGWALCYATAYGTFTIHASKLAYSSNSTSFILENATQMELIQLTAGLYNPWFDQRVYIGTVVAAAGGAIIAYVYRREKKTRSGSTP
jgi:hypothetical protein